MLTIVMLRHAKAVAQNTRDDHGRALNDRGRADATAIGTILHGTVPDLDVALVSDALRTRETAGLALAPWRGAVATRLLPALYGAPAETIIETLRGIEGPASAVVLIGHNPGIGDAARRLVGSGDADDLARLRERFPTATAAVIRCDITTWSDLREGSGRLAALLTPDGGDSD